MSIGTEIAKARNRIGISQEELSTRIPITRAAISKHETGERPCHKDLWKHYCDGINDAEFTLELHREATGGVFIPYFNGPLVEHHPASLAYLIREQIREAKEHMEQINFSKPFAVMEGHEIEHIDATIDELLDVQAAAQTLVIDLCSRIEGISFNEQVKRWITRRTATGMISRRNY